MYCEPVSPLYATITTTVCDYAYVQSGIVLADTACCLRLDPGSANYGFIPDSCQPQGGSLRPLTSFIGPNVGVDSVSTVCCPLNGASVSSMTYAACDSASYGGGSIPMRWLPPASPPPPPPPSPPPR